MILTDMRHECPLSEEEKIHMITLGLDPHPGSHSVVALDVKGASLANLTVLSTSEGLSQLHQFALSFPARR